MAGGAESGIGGGHGSGVDLSCRSLPAALDWQAVSFVRVEWPYIDGGTFDQTYPTELDPVHFAVVEDGLLHSYAATFRLRLEHQGTSYQTEMLGNVFTFPSSRRRGHGHHVVAAATAHILRSGAGAGALLCGPDLTQFYSHHGWEPASAGILVPEDASGEPAKLDALRMMLFVSDRGIADRGSLLTEPLRVPFAW